MEWGSVLTVLVGVIAVALLVQSIAILMLARSLGKSIERIETMLSQTTRDLQPVLESVRGILAEGRERIKSISSQIQDISADVLEISGMAKGQARRLDGLLKEASERLLVQIVRLDELVSDTVAKVEETGQTVQRAVLTPVREITAILSGVRATLDILLRRDRRAVDHATQDEELFI